MARGFRFVCGKCDHTIVAWDDGNPYYFESVITKTGKVKQKKIRLVFVRIRELFPEDQLSPDRSHTMLLDPQWVATISVDDRTVWPARALSR